MATPKAYGNAVREEGVGQLGTATTYPTLTSQDVAQKSAAVMRSLQKHMEKNAQEYVDGCQRRNITARPRTIVSSVGFKSRLGHFKWSYIPPSAYGYVITPEGVTRKWGYVMLHSFGYSLDYYYLGIDKKKKGKVGGQFKLRPPGDVYGHDPKRWFAGVQELTRSKDHSIGSKERRVSIHAMISRRGDIVVSCDLNDTAWHGGGDPMYAMPANNGNTVGIELEPCLGRNVPGGPHYLLNYTSRQMLCLAVYCKKLSMACPKGPISQHVVSRARKGSPEPQVAASLTGWIQHKDVSTKKSDAGAQFDIAPGTRGSGWDQLWRAMAKIRCTLATDVYMDPAATAVVLSNAAAFANFSVLLSQTTNPAQRAALIQLHYASQGVNRSLTMQTRPRYLESYAALGQARSTHDYIAGKTAKVVQMAARFDTSLLKGVSGGHVYDEETGLWSFKEVE